MLSTTLKSGVKRPPPPPPPPTDRRLCMQCSYNVNNLIVRLTDLLLACPRNSSRAHTYDVAACRQVTVLSVLSHGLIFAGRLSPRAQSPNRLVRVGQLGMKGIVYFRLSTANP